jgi:acetoacetyl-CoA reductase
MKRIALVTGGTRGIGAAISRELQRAGYTVAANYARNHAAAEEFTRQTGIPGYSWDAADFKECVQGVQKVQSDLGAIDILVNNAGITRDTAFHKMTEADWHTVINTNLTSLFNMCQVTFGGMRDRNFGRIINLSSINGQIGQFGQVNYCAAKAGVIGFTRALALEGAKKGITVNAVAPGYINTEMVAAVNPDIIKQIVDRIPVARLGTAGEIARAVLFLAGEDAGFITGTTLNINGGQHRF